MAGRKKRGGGVSICPSCYSPHLVHGRLFGSYFYLCKRCGATGDKLEKVSRKRAALHHHARKVRTHKAHATHHVANKRRFMSFLSRFHLRMWFRIASTIILAAGVVLMTSAEVWFGALLTIIGILGMWAGSGYE
ncbi:MAG: hypothetical protein ACLFO2_01885 [Candidatus Woesearchaeota archaeon]